MAFFVFALSNFKEMSALQILEISPIARKNIGAFDSRKPQVGSVRSNPKSVAKINIITTHISILRNLIQVISKLGSKVS